MTIKEISAIAAILAEWFPQAFVAEKHRPHRPLKIGVHLDLQQRCPALTGIERRIVLQNYASRVLYLQSLVAGASRVDLDGAPAGTVTAEEANRAAAQLAALIAARAAKQAAAVQEYDRERDPRRRGDRHQRAEAGRTP
jgi:ProP effector